MDQKCTFGLDMKTPLNASLSAFYRRSFAFHTVKNRMPVILTQTIDILVRSKESIAEVYGEKASADLKNVIGELSKLKYEIQTNKPFRKLESDTWDAEQYNKYLEDQSVMIDHPTFFNSVWLHSECYMYRRIREAFEVTNYLENLDPFENQKQQSFIGSLRLMEQLGTYLLASFKECSDKKFEFVKLLKLNLWGNKCDLSISNGIVKVEEDQLRDLDLLDSYILSDDSENIWNVIIANGESKILDIVLDNVGYELFTDLCLADFLITNKYVNRVRFYVKVIPWFISDVMTKDFKWTLSQMKVSDNSTLRELADRWNGYVKTGIWTIEEHDFWTLPVAFNEMTTYDIELYRKLSQAKLIIFKGDLNYRKLFGEKNWSPETSVVDSLQGFHPSKLCTLRTLKADIICGLKEGIAEITEEKDKNWNVEGNYGVIQFCDKVVKV